MGILNNMRENGKALREFRAYLKREKELALKTYHECRRGGDIDGANLWWERQDVLGNVGRRFNKCL